jgi:hypothetical protein
MPFVKLVASGPLSSCLCSVEPWLARLDGKCDLKTKMTINQELRTWTRNIFACWLLLVDSTNFTSGLLASLAPFGGQTDLHDLQNNLSSKAIWTPKTTFHGVMSEVKSVALIPTNSKLSLNPLYNVWLRRKHVSSVFEQFGDEILTVLLTKTNLSRLSDQIFSCFCKFRTKRWPIFVIPSRGVSY